AIKMKALGADHPSVATSLNKLAEMLSAEGLYDAAEPLYMRARAVWEKAFGPDHPDVATGLENYAALLRNTGRNDEAVTLESRAKATRAKHAEENP
ncbi:MAG: tetratricopeptide repeat protein, partial [Alphaproteobacteria bacterium]